MNPTDNKITTDKIDVIGITVSSGSGSLIIQASMPAQEGETFLRNREFYSYPRELTLTVNNVQVSAVRFVELLMALPPRSVFRGEVDTGPNYGRIIAGRFETVNY